MRTRLAVFAFFSAALAATVAVSASSGGVGSSATSPAPLVLGPARSLHPLHPAPQGQPLGFRPLHPEQFALAKAAANARAGLGVNAAKPRKGGGGGPTVTSYANVTPSFAGTYQTGLTPPDTTGAMGPDRYIEAVNTKYAIYSRSGSQIGSGSLSSLTGISTGLFGYSLSDPQMTWDVKTQRFYYLAVYYDSLFLSDNGLAIGWSKTATPSGSSDWCQYAISFGDALPDYPKLGDSSDFLLAGFNEFTNSASTYAGSEFVTVNKPPAGSTCADPSQFAVTESGFLRNGDGSSAATPVPANLVDDSAAGGAGYVVANADLSTVASASYVSVWSVTTSGTSNGVPVPLVSPVRTVPVTTYSMPSSARQQGSSYLLDTLDGRFEAAVAAVHGTSMAVWTAHAVYGGAGSEERWYELDPNAGTLLQSGNVSDPSLFVWNGAVSPDRNGTTGSFGSNMAMSVSTSGGTAYPAIQFVTKAGGNPQSAVHPLVQATGASVDFSCSASTPCRWGDYSGASPDPGATGAGRVWLGNQYDVAGGTTSGTSWRTWLFGVTPS